jgi:hypothetical protein
MLTARQGVTKRMTAGNDGASPPEDDDPFGYLYADGQASGATPPSGGGGYGYPGPRASYHRVRAVGERQYGQQGRTGGYGYPPQQGQGGYGYPPQQDGRTAAYGQVPQQGGYQQGYQQAGYQQAGYAQGGDTHYQAPETLPGGPQGPRTGPLPGHPEGRGRGRGGPNTKGLLIGAIAVVLAVAIGIGIAMFSDSGSPDDTTAKKTPGSGTTSPSASAAQGDSGTTAPLPKSDAKDLQLAGGTYIASQFKGAQAADGQYVAGLNHVGASATWTVQDIPSAGKYSLYIGYGVPGKDANAHLTVDGKPQTGKLSLKNWAGAPQGDWEKGWTSSYTWVTLNKGTNTFKISCEQGDQCDANLDRVWLVKGWVHSSD